MIFDEIGAEKFLEKEGFPVAKKFEIGDKQQLVNAARNLGFPCVLKISSHEATHKAKIGGVKVLYNAEKIDETFDSFQEIAKKVDGKIILQKFENGKELLVGLKKDPVFGHVLLVGIGGSYTEIIKDINFKILHGKVSVNELKEMLKSLKNFSLIEHCNLDSVSHILLKISQVAEKFPDIKELDINPLIVNEKEAVVVDARMIK